MNQKDNREKPKSSYTRGQRIAAMTGVFFLIGLYILTLIAGITTSPQAPGLFQMCIGSSILLPVMFWLYIRFAGLFIERDRKNYQAAIDSETAPDDTAGQDEAEDEPRNS